MRRLPARGMSLIDVIVGTAIMLVVFLALFGVLRASLTLSTLGKAKAAASAIAETQMEYLRSLSYDNLGTQGGIPAGTVPQDTTTDEDGLSFNTHTFVSYVDDPADGTGASDENGITTDYKRARVDVSYIIAGQDKDVVLVSDFAPPGIETSTGGGTLEIQVVDATGAAVEGASVHITNAATTPTVNVTTLSNASGIVYLGGAATSTEYQAFVSKTGYSSAQTYARDTTNQNPNPGYLTVVKNQTTTQTFAIDRLATLSIRTYTPMTTSTFADAFADASKLASMSSTTASGGALTLAAGETKGSARSIATTSAYLAHWGQLMATTSIPSGAAVAVHVYSGGTLVPDTALPGNAAGFTSFPVSLAGISTSTYPSLSVGAELSAAGGNAPVITGWSLSYAAGPVPLPSVSFTLTGTKTEGSEGDGTPIYKNVVSAATDGTGLQVLTLEWDSYALSLSGYRIADACPSPPYALSPGTETDAALYLVAASGNSLRVSVTDNAGAAVGGATVTLSRPGYAKSLSSSSCGFAYFGGLSSASDYAISIAKSGYTTANFTGVSVSGGSTYAASFP